MRTWLCVHVHMGPPVREKYPRCWCVISESVVRMFLPVPKWVIHPQAAFCRSVCWSSLLSCHSLSVCPSLPVHRSSIHLCVRLKEQDAVFCWAGVMVEVKHCKNTHLHLTTVTLISLFYGIWCCCPYICLSVHCIYWIYFCFYWFYLT